MQTQTCCSGEEVEERVLIQSGVANL